MGRNRGKNNRDNDAAAAGDGSPQQQQQQSNMKNKKVGGRFRNWIVRKLHRKKAKKEVEKAKAEVAKVNATAASPPSSSPKTDSKEKNSPPPPPPPPPPEDEAVPQPPQPSSEPPKPAQQKNEPDTPISDDDNNQNNKSSVSTASKDGDEIPDVIAMSNQVQRRKKMKKKRRQKRKDEIKTKKSGSGSDSDSNSNSDTASSTPSKASSKASPKASAHHSHSKEEKEETIKTKKSGSGSVSDSDSNSNSDTASSTPSKASSKVSSKASSHHSHSKEEKEEEIIPSSADSANASSMGMDATTRFKLNTLYSALKGQELEEMENAAADAATVTATNTTKGKEEREKEKEESFKLDTLYAELKEELEEMENAAADAAAAATDTDTGKEEEEKEMEEKEEEEEEVGKEVEDANAITTTNHSNDGDGDGDKGIKLSSSYSYVLPPSIAYSVVPVHLLDKKRLRNTIDREHRQRRRQEQPQQDTFDSKKFRVDILRPKNPMLVMFDILMKMIHERESAAAAVALNAAGVVNTSSPAAANTTTATVDAGVKHLQQQHDLVREPSVASTDTSSSASEQGTPGHSLDRVQAVGLAVEVQAVEVPGLYQKPVVQKKQQQQEEDTSTRSRSVPYADEEDPLVALYMLIANVVYGPEQQERELLDDRDQLREWVRAIRSEEEDKGSSPASSDAYTHTQKSYNLGYVLAHKAFTGYKEPVQAKEKRREMSLEEDDTKKDLVVILSGFVSSTHRLVAVQKPAMQKGFAKRVSEQLLVSGSEVGAVTVLHHARRVLKKSQEIITDLLPAYKEGSTGDEGEWEDCDKGNDKPTKKGSRTKSSRKSRFIRLRRNRKEAENEPAKKSQIKSTKSSDSSSKRSQNRGKPGNEPTEESKTIKMCKSGGRMRRISAAISRKQPAEREEKTTINERTDDLTSNPTRSLEILPSDNFIQESVSQQSALFKSESASEGEKNDGEDDPTATAADGANENQIEPVGLPASTTSSADSDDSSHYNVRKVALNELYSPKYADAVSRAYEDAVADLIDAKNAPPPTTGINKNNENCSSVYLCSSMPFTPELGLADTEVENAVVALPSHDLTAGGAGGWGIKERPSGFLWNACTGGLQCG